MSKSKHKVLGLCVLNIILSFPSFPWNPSLVITFGKIKGGGTYLSSHLRSNDYYAGEGEEKIQGVWRGKLAGRLGLEGSVGEEEFEALRVNQNPMSGEKLTERSKEISFYDIQFSAPKDVSVLAIVGKDERVVDAFQSSVAVALNELEHFAATRVRKEGFAWTEKKRHTGELCAAVFHHDSSRLLDPQLHAHAVMANATWDKVENKFKALDERRMMEASKFVREVLYSELASRLEGLGYQTGEHSSSGFSIVGVEHLRERFSARALNRQEFEKRYVEVFGSFPSKKRVEHFIRDGKEAAALRFIKEYSGKFNKTPSGKLVENFVQGWREQKLTEISTPEVRKLQQSKLSAAESKDLLKLVRSAGKRGNSLKRVHDKARVRAIDALEMGMRDVFERKSVAEDHEVLAAAMQANRGALDASKLRAALSSHPEIVRHEGKMTLRSIIREENTIMDFVEATRGSKGKLAQSGKLSLETKASPGLSRDQYRAARVLADSKNGVSALIGDAGTGKTFLLERLRASSSNPDWIALAPTGRARDELKKNGFPEAITLQSLLAKGDRDALRGKTVLLDEAGMVSVPDMARLCRLASEADARLLLAGDTKQHASVERGDALRAILEVSGVEVARLGEVRRQRSRAHALISEAMAAGKPGEAIERAGKAGMVHEIADENLLFKKAAKAYVHSIANSEETLVICPTWKEIDRFNIEARRELKSRQLIAAEDVPRLSVKSLSWTAERKRHLWEYKKDQVLVFHKAVRNVKAGESLTVESVDAESGKIETLNSAGASIVITKKQAGAYDVCEQKNILLSAGERILFRANCPEAGMNNGETAMIQAISREGDILLENGKTLSRTFSQITYGHAVTSHKSQGASVRNSISLVGSHSMMAANLQQFYVSNTRYQVDNKIYTCDLEQLKSKVRRSNERMLGSELEQRLRSAGQGSDRDEHGFGNALLAALKRKAGLARDFPARWSKRMRRSVWEFSRHLAMTNWTKAIKREI